MRPFTYERASSAQAAFAVGNHDKAVPAFLAGGTTLIDLMKLDVMRPNTVVDINPLSSGAMGRIEASQSGLRLGALVRMGAAAEHAAIQHDYPVIAQSLKLAASQQIRNMASLGGNVLQRTRCTYFRDVSYSACNKRVPGSGCSALDGFNRAHAVLGTSENCIATYAGDFAQAMIALDAHVEVAGPNGARTIAFAALHRLPGDNPAQETTLRTNELIAAFLIPASRLTRRSLYLKIRDRESYEFALASAAVALDINDGSVRESRIALGGVATVPWRAKEAEAALRGKPLNDETAQAAAEAAFAAARGRDYNGFKIDLGKRTLSRALLQAAKLEI